MNIKDLKKKYPILVDVENLKEVNWKNKKVKKFNDLEFEISFDEIVDAEDRLKRFAPYLKEAFKEEKFDGIIESPIKKLNNVKEIINENLKGEIFLKCDNLLPIAGSVKARGGIYEVLKHAEDVLIENKLLNYSDDYEIIMNGNIKKFLSNYTISVGSTGNLGLSIGIMGTKLGFNVEVHMSIDAKKWKKDLLREKGAIVFEYKSDYSEAVKEGRKRALKDKNNYFIDDENSKNLFLGYAVAGLRLKKQFRENNINISNENKLFVYIPCGVGGGPSGIAYGLKYIFKDNIRIYFVEPTHSPCMLISMITGLGNEIQVSDFNIDNITEADGLAVGRASKLATRLMKNIINGIYSIDDEKLFSYLSVLNKYENINLEPSATAGLVGIEKNNQKGLHLVWATGGNLVPNEIFSAYLGKYKKIQKI